MVSGFEFTEIVILQSLSDDEVKTGQAVFEFISASVDNEGNEIPSRLIDIESSSDFVRIVSELTILAKSTGFVPILHVECHGSPQDGLSFSDGSDMSWSDVASILLPLNIATGFNLLAIFAACFGSYFLEQMSALKKCPCWCVIAPTKTVAPYEVMRGFYDFYARFFETMDAGKAVAVLENLELSSGRWFGYPAEVWFEMIMRDVLFRARLKSLTKKRIKSVRKEVLAGGRYVSIGRAKRILNAQNKNILNRGYFEMFFCVDLLPSNAQRFSDLKKRLRSI